MIKYALIRFKLSDQLKADFLKVFSLIEKTILAFLLIVLIFVFMEKIGVTDAFLAGAVTGGTIGFSAITSKKMYHDEAFSELIIHADLTQDMLRSAILAMGYSEKKDRAYFPNKKTFSIFYYCKSEIITHKAQGKCHILTGPHNKLLKLSNIISRKTSN